MKPVPSDPGDSSEGPRPEGPRLQARSAWSFDHVYGEYFPFVWRCLRALGVPLRALDDVAHDVFLVVHRQLPNFRGESSAQTWLFGIARHVASNHKRWSRRKQAPLEPLGSDAPDLARGPLEHAQDAEAAAFVAAFLARTDEKKRDLFILAVLEQMTIPEVAAALSIPINTAYTRLRAVRADFERALGHHEP